MCYFHVEHFERDFSYSLRGTATLLTFYNAESRPPTLGVTFSRGNPNRKILNNSHRAQKDYEKNSIVVVHKVQPTREFTCLRKMGYRMLLQWLAVGIATRVSNLTQKVVLQIL